MNIGGKYDCLNKNECTKVKTLKGEVEERVGLLAELKAQERDLIAAKTAVKANIYEKYIQIYQLKDIFGKYIWKIYSNMSRAA